MRRGSNVRQVEELRKKLKLHQLKKLNNFQSGLFKAGLALQADSQKIVPVETGALKSSAKTEMTGNAKKPEVTVSYSVPYATVVHEDLEKAHGKAYNEKYADDIASGTKFARGENQQAKFIETPLRENQSKYRQIIINESRK